MAWLPKGWEDILAKVVAAIAVIVLCIVIWRLFVKPFFDKREGDPERRVGLTIFKSILRVTIWAWAICSVADILFDFDLAGVIGALGVVGIAVSLGAQQTIANVIGGIIVSFWSTANIGDWIVVDGHKEGRLVDTNWRCTMLEDEDGIQYAVPNSVMVSAVIKKGHPFFPIVIPFSLKTTTPDVAALLLECEQAVLDAQVESGTDYEGMRPKAHIASTSIGAIGAEIKVYANRNLDTRSVERAILPALIELLQEKDALAQIANSEARIDASSA